MKTVREALTQPIHRVVYWSDSLDVMWWINSINRRYHLFMAARVNEILDMQRSKNGGGCRRQTTQPTKPPGKLLQETPIGGAMVLSSC